MSKRWSKLQKRLYNLTIPEFQIHCSLYEMNSNDGWHGNKLPRYFITVGKEIVFDYPKQFDTTEKYGFNSYPWDCDISEISDLLDEYIQRPAERIMEPIESDRWGLTDILRACDRRIGQRRLREIYLMTENETVKKIIDGRRNTRRA